MTPRVQEILKRIDLFLSEGNDDSRALWQVLTALRGPDEPRVGKNGTTCVIRTRALPITHNRIMKGGDWHPIGATFADPAQTNVVLDAGTVGSHFLSHIKNAARVLGIPVVRMEK